MLCFIFSFALQHKLTVGRGLKYTCLTLIVMSWGMLFSSVSQEPIETLATADFPLNSALSKLLNAPESLMTLISLPATYATCFGFMYAYGRQMHAMVT